MADRDLRLLFRTAAGPRLGFGHLIRCRSLSRALGIAPVVSLRGTARTRRAARRLGLTLTHDDGHALLDGGRPSVLVVDDPSADHAGVWVNRARRMGIPVATVHDLGLGYVPSDLGIDGSVLPHRAMRGRLGDLRGPAYAILDPQVHRYREQRPALVEPKRVLIALGGGAHVRSLAALFAEAVAARHPDARIRIAAGFSGSRRMPPLSVGTWIAAPDGLADELARCEAAVLAGGVSLYEACALGVPAVAVALTPAQGLTIRGMAGAGAAVDGGLVGDGRAGGAGRTAARLAAHMARLLADTRARRRLSASGRALVDGRGVYRVADRLTQLAGTRLEARHAA